VIVSVLGLFSLVSLPVHSAGPSVKKRIDGIDSSSIRTYASLSIHRSFPLASGTDTIQFLLSNLNVTTAIIRAWNLEKFSARQLQSGLYRARDGAGLRGLIVELESGDTSIQLGGTGRFRSSRLPFSVRGNALADISWHRTTKEKLRIQGRLFVRVHNPIIHIMSQLFRPILRNIARRKTNHLIKIARKTIKKIQEHPDETRQRLGKQNPSVEQAWQRFLDQVQEHPSRAQP